MAASAVPPIPRISGQGGAVTMRPFTQIILQSRPRQSARHSKYLAVERDRELISPHLLKIELPRHSPKMKETAGQSHSRTGRPNPTRYPSPTKNTFAKRPARARLAKRPSAASRQAKRLALAARKARNEPQAATRLKTKKPSAQPPSEPTRPAQRPKASTPSPAPLPAQDASRPP